MNKFFLLLIVLIINNVATAQLDSTRIKTFNDKLQVGLFLSDNYATTTYTSLNNSLTQTPILKPTLGLQFAYNGAILALGTGVPIPTFRYNQEDYETTDAININGYLSRPKYVLWGAFRLFQGFEYSDNQTIVGNPIFINAAASYMHIFNENKYSFRAAYRQSDQQLKSGGSWLVKVGASYNSVVDSTLNGLRTDAFRGMQSQGISALGGYGYTLNLNENWFVSALLLGGIDFQRGKYNGVTLQPDDAPYYSFAPTYDFKSSIGYNTDKFYISLVFSVDNRLGIRNSDEINIEHRYLKSDIRFGTRIDAPEVLTKIKFLN